MSQISTSAALESLSTNESLSKEQGKFLGESLDDLYEAIDAVDDDTVSGSTLNPRFRTRGVKDYLSDYLTKTVWKHPKYWRDHAKFLNALRSGVKQGAIDLRTVNDADTLSLAFTHRLYTIPQVVEYYCATGEFIELLEAFKVNDIEPTGQQQPFAPREDTNTKLLRFYAHDLKKAYESFAAEGDPRGHMELPLEIRVPFSRVLETSGADMDTWFTRSKPLGVNHTKLMPYTPYRRLRFDL